MTTKAQETDWNKLTVVQLKGALARRSLSGEGAKEELVKRLQEHDKKGNDDSVAVAPKEEKVSSEPYLTKYLLHFGYNATIALRTVKIVPFSHEMFKDDKFRTLLDECRSFEIVKTLQNTQHAELYFRTIEKGDSAYVELKTTFSEAEVCHPKLSRNYNSHFEKNPAGNTYYSRLILLEGLSASMNTEEKLLELFPEAVNAIAFQFFNESSGIAVLEFQSVTEASEYQTNVGKKIEIEGECLAVSNFADRVRIWEKRKIHTEVPKKEVTGNLSDEARLETNKELNELHKHDVGNDEDIHGQEKLTRFYKEIEKQKELRHILAVDTRRRLSNGDTTVPEPEDEIQPSILTLLNKKKYPSGKPVPVEDQEIVVKQLADLDRDEQTAVRQLTNLRNRIRKAESQLNATEKRKRDSLTISSSGNRRNVRLTSNKQPDRVTKRTESRSTMLAKASVLRARRGQRNGAPSGRIQRGGLQTGQIKRGNEPMGRGQTRQPKRFSGSGPPGSNFREEGYRQREQHSGGNRMGRGGYMNTSRNSNQDDWRSMTSTPYSAGNRRKRPGSSAERGAGPPYKMGREDRRPQNTRRDSYNRYEDNDRSYNSGKRDAGRGGNMSLIQGITTALTDKMMQLEQLQQATLQTQAQLLAPTGTFGAAMGGSYNSGLGGQMGLSNQPSNSGDYNYSPGMGGSGNYGTNYGSSNTGNTGNYDAYGSSRGGSSNINMGSAGSTDAAYGYRGGKSSSANKNTYRY